MTVSERIAYIKGLVEGLKLDDDKDEVKVIKALIDVVDDLAEEVMALEEDFDEVCEQVDEIDEDLGDIEEIVYDEEDDCDCCDDEDAFVVECPECGEEIYIDEDIAAEGKMECPCCGTPLEFDFDDDCCCDDDDCCCDHDHE